MKKTKMINLKRFRYLLLLLMLISVIIARYFQSVGEFYALNIYPFLSSVLIRISSLVPFSLTEVVAIVSLLVLLLYPFCKRYYSPDVKWKNILGVELEMMVWLYVWFYWSWGMNYYRYDFFQRTEIDRATFNKEEFATFLNDFTEKLNACSWPSDLLPHAEVQEEIKELYSKLPVNWGIMKPLACITPKKSMVNSLYSKVGVLGYIGPFFDELHLNAQLFSFQYPFTYAHELSHVLGISSEAEANFWAYAVCLSSSNDYIRYCGYMGLLPYVVNNARVALEKEEYYMWLRSVDRKALDELSSKSAFWRSQYSPLIGEIQNKIYDFFLRGNRIPSGLKNYSEVISLVISAQKNHLVFPL